MIRFALVVVLLLASAGLPLPAFAAPRAKTVMLPVRPLFVAAEAKAEMARYSLKAYENRDATNVVKGLLFTPKSMGMNALPMVVYIPGRGEIGEVEGHFRQRAIFDRVTSAEFQEKYPCFLLALTPPASATTILGGMPGHPIGLQKALRDFALDICRMQTKPKVDLNRLYVTGFSYGGMGAYALAQHFPGTFAAAVPIAALPPLPEYFDKGHPGSWWHFHNEGDYAEHGIDVQAIALSLAPAVLWIAVRRWLGYGGVPDWDLCGAPNFGHIAYAAWCEARTLGVHVVPIAATALLVRPFRMTFVRNEFLATIVPAALLLLAIPLACAFHTSPHAHWMMDNTIPRLLWYVFAVPLAVFCTGEKYTRRILLQGNGRALHKHAVFSHQERSDLL